ncbi:bifunctional [glutamate--ammonia ligase]-adenylyl-L-tyrosine phosphorylase/[glutamate--ammonia-ligase] adenylyltransferase [Methylophaga pinxianii]|uniref:bifunctional [glutamate--ammonia ligase]-adenylyl-L-tyrosine phosphorylase/[glutamate--ammonia-ligase] adenylyltransferase n=2 Tax=Methylophaga pinxianii TaxID=2881052 RepID=UPI001FF73F25|nr:bifunctional [glutamate--ammonia ligase]-adenylyl-L-tyrosine phosphorylase/[glutamate--ammonia-ligase] adenylyltransferase [Methylophaga pinxianii]UPH46265.1 bifunctional [glutamate--ammonia ligase]-adenylyl-L-tyrosine phosphorylase/[glutamate--ammonia-ligase] adenylyltransferase [Methylophaga pinxianii]
MTRTPLTQAWQSILQDKQNLLDSASTVLMGSEYVLNQGDRQPQRLRELVESGDLEKVYTDDGYQHRLQSRLADVKDEAQLHQQLRFFRQREMVRIIWRDLAGWADLAETMRELTALADCCVEQALDKLYLWQTELLGIPMDRQQQKQSLIVLGMGKMGAGELNLSSDIDLIFTYPEEGETTGARKSLTNEEFFTRLGRKLIQALDNVTVDGFVFRVDMRLRPFGESGSLVASFDAMEDYYQTQGREWERYAMIKARPITGSAHDRKAISELLRPFVYRRYLDYGMFDSLREMKSMIAGQLHLKGMEDNIKLGAGGIREIEFIGQVFQLIYGGRDRPLQQRPILTILELLAQRKLLSGYAVKALKDAYYFLRRTEHRIQAWADQQTHLLPKDEEARARLALSMGFENWPIFLQTLNEHRQQVHEHFEQLLTAPQAEDESTESIALLTASEAEVIAYLEKWGYHDPQQAQQTIEKLLNLHVVKNLSHTGLGRLKKLLPLLVQAAAGTNDPDTCLTRMIPLLESIMRRSAYMSLLVENTLALSQLVKLCAASPLISHQLARYPVLLDELLDPRSLYEVPGREQQKALLHQFLSVADETDLEQQMNLLREFRQIATLHVAAADVTEVLPLMRVGDQLSELAEIQLERALQLAWLYLTSRHGLPPRTNESDMSTCGFSVIAYGKLGGLELGYGSDLDLVFVFDDAREGVTNGDKPVELMVFYTRLAQRMIHLLNTVTSGGVLYEVDMRLRPRGNSGLLVSPISGFADYQQNEAWTWEHQALVRARCVAGDQKLAEQFSDIRQQVLSKPRTEAELAKEVSEMRQKMRQQLDKSSEGQFDLKQGIGGITDIEFMVQYAVLAWSSSLPDLMVYTDNIRILDALVTTGKLSQQEGTMLADAYRYYRSEANHCVLQEQPALVPVAKVADFKQQVNIIWQRWLS